MSVRDQLMGAVRAHLFHVRMQDATDEAVTAEVDALLAEVRNDLAGDLHQAELPVFAADERPELVARTVRAVDVRLVALGSDAPYSAQGADFFRPGCTYAYSAWRFRCDLVTRHPGTGERRALGWFRQSSGKWSEFSSTESEWAEGAWELEQTPLYGPVKGDQG